MALRRIALFAILLGLVSGPPPARTQTPAPSGAVIQTETKLVLVDTVVTDKKGNYLHDLAVKDFRVWEDNKEQTIKSFSFEADPAAPLRSQRHYLVLFFDNSTMDTGDQIHARQAALKFIETNAGKNHLMAIVNFGGSLQIAQNFTEDTERLKNVVNGVKFSAVAPNDTSGPTGLGSMPQLATAAASFGARDVMLSLRSLAKSLGAVPGRKTLILFTAGFPLDQEMLSEVTATVDVANKSNVAIYPIDVRGLAAGIPAARLELPSFDGPTLPASGLSAFLKPVAFSPGSMAFFAMPQHGGGGGGHPGGGGGGVGGGGVGGGGGRPGGGGPVGGRPGGGNPGGGNPGGGRPGGGTTGTGTPSGGRPVGGGGGGVVNPGMYGNPAWSNPYNQSRMLIPKLPESTSVNQDVMFALATGTGGFVIHDTNDLLGGLEKIGKEEDEYYILGYTPPDSEEGSCHSLRVKVDRGGTQIRSRSGYCNAKPQDFLAGNPVEKDLENHAAASQPGNVAASMQLPFFYTAPNEARVNVAMDIATDSLKFEKQKGKYHADINVLGIAYLADGSVAARFSDTVKLESEDKKQMEALKEKPLHYENQFEIAAGHYNLKVVFQSAGQNFGKLEMPLTVDPYQPKQFEMSGIALSQEYHPANGLGSSLDAVLLEDHTPLIAQGMQIIPAGSNQFKKTDPLVFYAEIYEPLMVTPDPQKPTVVGFQLRILEAKSGQQKEDTGVLRVEIPPKSTLPVIPVAGKIPMDPLSPGAYVVELRALDSAGKEFKRSINMQIE